MISLDSFLKNDDGKESMLIRSNSERKTFVSNLSVSIQDFDDEEEAMKILEDSQDKSRYTS